MFKPDNKVFEERREVFFNKLSGKAAIIPAANLVSIMQIVNILLDKIVIFGI